MPALDSMLVIRHGAAYIPNLVSIVLDDYLKPMNVNPAVDVPHPPTAGCNIDDTSFNFRRPGLDLKKKKKIEQLVMRGDSATLTSILGLGI